MKIHFNKNTNGVEIQGDIDIEKIFKVLEQISYLAYGMEMNAKALRDILVKRYGLDEKEVDEIINKITQVSLESEENRNERIKYYQDILETYFN